MKEDTTKFETTAINGQNPSVFDYLRARGETQYPTEDLQVYASAISKMNLGDLQAHAMDRGIKPSPDRRKLEALLINQFKAVATKKKANLLSRKVTPAQLQLREDQRRKSVERSGFLRTLA